MKKKKSLGQNFFINEHLGQKIVTLILKKDPKTVVEIGPGEGFFTRKIHEQIPSLICIEKDDILAKRLCDKSKSLIVYNEDFLDFDFKKLSGKPLFFGSLPYNVSKPIIRKIITSEYFTESAFFIIQKEVADKYIAKKPNNNLLSLMTDIYATPKRLFNIKSGSFRPKPKVTSTFIEFIPKEKISIPNGFENFLKLAFRSPRKTLKNNLNLKENSPILKKRPAELNLNEFVMLFNRKMV